jgi:hypothetical protein
MCPSHGDGITGVVLKMKSMLHVWDIVGVKLVKSKLKQNPTNIILHVLRAARRKLELFFDTLQIFIV